MSDHSIKEIEYSKIPKTIKLNTKIYLKKLNINLINPSSNNFTSYESKKLGGDKIVMIGKPATGKSILMKDILFNKKNIIPLSVVISETEELNHCYSEIIPSSFIYNKYDEMVIKDLLKRQEQVKNTLENPWVCLILDDCFSDPKHFTSELQQKMFKNLRHYCALYIIALQYALDIKPNIRVNIDGVFIFKEPNQNIRKKIFDNYASIIPNFDLFCKILDDTTEDKGTLFIKNNVQSNNWLDCVFWYKAEIHNNWRFGSQNVWDYDKLVKR
jgi:uncharacterized protein (DUF302 family)